MNHMTRDGYPTGCLPRTTGYGEQCDKLKDRVVMATEAEIRDAIARPYEETLMRCVWTVFKQTQGSCAAEAGTGTIQLVRSFNGLPKVELSPHSVYAFTSGGKDRGSSVGETLIHLRDVGVLTMKTWPRDSIPWKRKPSRELLETEACLNRADEFLDIDSRDEMRTALVKNFPIQFGWNGHSCILLALKDRDTAYYLNSWGSSWSQTEWPGIGVIRLRDVDLKYEAWALRTTVDGGTA